MFEKVKKETAADKVSIQLRALIERGEVKAGDKIPSERELCEMMAVSRIAVREAIKGLAAKGFLEVRTGEGTFVKSITADDLIDPLTARLMDKYTLRDLLESRWVIEVHLAGFAAERATEADTQEMARIIRQMQQDIDEGKDYLEMDMAFHNAIAHAGGNQILAAMMNQVSDLIREAIRQTSQVPGASQRAVQIHDVIYEKILHKDVKGAQKAMSSHLKEVEKGLLDYQELGRDE